MINSRDRVFVDTSAFIGLIVKSDSVHPSAVRTMAELKEKKCRLFTTEFVLFELANALSAVRYRETASAFIDRIIANSAITIAWSNSNLFDSARALYKNRLDKNWSLTDCASFVVMNDLRLAVAFTTDGHFEQAGFVKLLEQ